MSDTTRLEHYIDDAAPGRLLGPSSLSEGYRGVLLGVAAGNALGIGIEGRDRRSILNRFPDGLREVSVIEREALWDDDLAQTALLAEAVLESGRLDIDDLGRRLVTWLEENGRGHGNQTAEVLQRIRRGTRAAEAARSVWEERRDMYGDGPAGNGAVMRCSPVALRWRTVGRRLIEETETSAVVTHYDPRCVWSAIAVNALLARCLNSAPLALSELAAGLREAGAPVDVAHAVDAADRCSLDDLGLDDYRNMGYTLKAMQAGVWAAQQASDFESIIVAVVNAGGDTDTNGAVAGAIAGALHGSSSIPTRWIENIRDTQRLVELADRLLQSA